MSERPQLCAVFLKGKSVSAFAADSGPNVRIDSGRLLLTGPVLRIVMLWKAGNKRQDGAAMEMSLDVARQLHAKLGEVLDHYDGGAK